MITFRSLLQLAALTLGGSAAAHHSYAMFQRVELDLSGTVQAIGWNNPHVYLKLLVPDAHGNSTVWVAEAGGPGDLLRSGWKYDEIKPGDKVTVGIAPLRDGRHGGALAFVIEANGKRLNTGPFSRPGALAKAPAVATGEAP